MKAKPLAWIIDGNCIRCLSHAAVTKGYPAFRRYGRSTTIARHIVTRRHGPLPFFILARHTCDNVWCIRPDHIIIGTAADNVRDMFERNRQPEHKRGEQNPCSKLSDSDVRTIRAATCPQLEIAKRFGICQAQVSRIKARTRRVHVL